MSLYRKQLHVSWYMQDQKIFYDLMKKNGEQDSLHERSKKHYQKSFALNLNSISCVVVYCEDVNNCSVLMLKMR